MGDWGTGQLTKLLEHVRGMSIADYNALVKRAKDGAMKIDLVEQIVEAMEPYKFPKSSVYPNVCYVALTEQEIAESILTHLNDAFWPKSVTVKEVLEQNLLIPIIAKALKYYANFPLYSDIVYVVRSEKEFCKVIAETLKECFKGVRQELLLVDQWYLTNSFQSKLRN